MGDFARASMSTAEVIRPARRVAGLLPIVGWLGSYDRRWLRGDLIAGVTVAALIVPKNLGYAGIAGIPLQNGLYAAAAGAILYAIFGTCRQISMGPSSGLAAVAASAVATAGITAPGDIAAFVAGITLVSGLLFLLLAVVRMGWIAQFLSRAVVTGFLFGAAIDVVIGELPKLTGTDTSGSNSFQELRSWFGTLGETHGATFVVGVGRWSWCSASGWWLPGSRAHSSSSSAVSSPPGCSDSAIGESLWSGTSRAVCRPSASRARRSCWTTRAPSPSPLLR